MVASIFSRVSFDNRSTSAAVRLFVGIGSHKSVPFRIATCYPVETDCGLPLILIVPALNRLSLGLSTFE
jgi:hypothetical protein